MIALNFLLEDKLMKKQKLFKAIDLIIYLNVVIFIVSGIPAVSQNLQVAIFTFVIAIINLVFIIMTILLRIDYNKRFLEKIDLDLKAESNLNKKNQNEYNRAKQMFLETRIESEIRHKMPDAKIIRNAYVPRSDGKSSEIDLIVISTKGIFIIESKNITGKVIGDWKQDMLSIQHPGVETFDFPNPINQNTQHFYTLRSYLGLNTNFFRSIVVFSDLSFIDSYKNVPYDAQVCQLDNLIDSMNKIAKRYGTTIEEHMVESIYENLINLVEKTEEKEKEHIERIKSRKE